MQNITIISNGVGNHTRVLDQYGNDIPGVTSIRINEITNVGLVTASITIEGVGLEVEANITAGAGDEK